MIAANREAISIANLALFWTEISLKAKRVINIDMVNPIPATIPTENICLNLNPLGSEQSLSLTPIKLINQIPNGFPINSPRIIPMLYGWRIVLVKSPSILMAVLARANIGITKKETGWWRNNSNLREQETSFVFLNGMAKANKTPVMVGWMPEV